MVLQPAMWKALDNLRPVPLSRVNSNYLLTLMTSEMHLAHPEHGNNAEIEWP